MGWDDFGFKRDHYNVEEEEDIADEDGKTLNIIDLIDKNGRVLSSQAVHDLIPVKVFIETEMTEKYLFPGYFQDQFSLYLQVSVQVEKEEEEKKEENTET